MEPNAKELLDIKLKEYREQLQFEMKRVYEPDKQERDELETELRQLNSRASEIKTRIKEVTENSKANRDKVLALSRKMKAIDQLL